MKVMQLKSSGSEVTDLQRRLRLLGYDMGVTGVDGIFGTRTMDAVKRFQQDRELRVSGIVDHETWQELVDAGYKIGDRLLYLKNPPYRGDDVRTLQLWLKTLGFYPDNENGIFEEKTHRALLEFQDNMDINDDGIVGEQTLTHLIGLQKIIIEKKTSNFPYIRHKSGKEKAYTVIFDFNPSAYRMKGKQSYSEKNSICSGIIKFCCEILKKQNISAMLSFDEGESGDISVFDRISRANKSKADLCISIGLSSSSDKDANGSSCYYFKGLKSYSIGGFQLAESIQDQLVGNMDLQDCRVHGANYAILKSTEMISVVVEPAFITNSKQKDQLLEEGYQKKLSENICRAVSSFLLDH